MPRRLALLAAAVLVAGACAADDGAASTTREPELDWEKCKDKALTGAQCAKVKVPLDYETPEGDTIEISVTRIKATSKADRIGALFVNPGGPGSTAALLVPEIAHLMPDPIGERFDVIGVDPRGTGASKLDCDFDMTELFGADPYVQTPDEKDALVDVTHDYVEKCRQEVGTRLPHMGTRDAARDIDHVRDLLGDDQLSYLGMSYGTILGQAYAELFPQRVRAMVLDSSEALGPTGLAIAEGQAAGFERALAAFAADCNPKPDCPIAPDAMGAVNQLLAKTEAAPVAARPRDLGPGELALGLSLPLYDQSMWPDLATAVADGLQDDGTKMVKLADQYLGQANFDLYYAVNCTDFAWPTDPNGVLDAASQSAPTAPHFGPAIINAYLECATWPAAQDPLPPISAPVSPQIMVVAASDDPATPYQDAVAVAQQTGGVLLTRDGEGHVSVGEGNRCIDGAVTAYLVDGTLPSAGTTCPTP